jgi:hypothetical protein
MFPVNRLRMNSIYGDSPQQAEFGPPDFHGGMDIQSILPGILAALQQENEKDRSFKREMLQPKQQQTPMLQQIGQQVKQPIQHEEPKKTFLPPTYNGMSASDYFNLEEKKREFEGKSTLGERGLDVKEKGLENTKELGEKKLEEKTTNDKARTEIAQHRADIYDFKAKHPNAQIIRTKGGNIHIYDPVTQTTHDTGIDSGTLSDEDEINLKGEHRIEAIDRGSQNRLAEISERLSGQKELADKNNAAKQELQNTRPATYQGEFFRNPKDTTSDNNPERKLPPAKDTVLPNEAKVPEGRVVVYDKDGKPYHLPASQLDEAIKQGYFKDKPKGGKE